MPLKKSRTTKRGKKARKQTTKRNLSIAPASVKRSRRRRRRLERLSDLETQIGAGIASVLTKLPKAAWGITKGLEKLAKKNAQKNHEKVMAEIRSGKRKRYAGESLTCTIM